MRNKNVFLRELRETDILKINLWRNDFELKRLTFVPRFPISAELDGKWYQSMSTDTQNKNVYFAIETIQHVFVGIVQLMSIDWINRTADVGIFIGDKENRGKQIGHNSLILIMDYAFNTINLYKISAHIAAYNKASLSLFRSCGFEQEGYLKEQLCYGEQRSDVVIMSKRQKDFKVL